MQLLKPSALIGVSTNPDCFTEEIIKLMTATNGRPIIFPLSNPTRKSECTFAAAVQHSDGKVISPPRPQHHAIVITRSAQVLFASGSPFDDYTHGGVTLRPAQANNAYIFPGHTPPPVPPLRAAFSFSFSLCSQCLVAGIGLGAIVSGMKNISDECFLVSAKSLSEQTTAEDLKAGCLFPALENIRAVSGKVRARACEADIAHLTARLVLQVAAAVAEFAWSSGIATAPKPADVLSHVTASMWEPLYPQAASAL